MTMADVKGLSDHALSILAFAAYHRLVSGERVTSVVRKDGAGHEADPKGVAELTERGLATADDTEISLGDEAQEAVETLVDALRRVVG
jgi:phosphotransferase system HPr-like phosphotransfer protein